MYVDIYNTGNKYKTIYVDPPWKETGGGKIKRGADRHYPLMTTKEIIEVPVDRLIHEEGSHLYLWTTNNFLKDAFVVIDAWGFEYVTMITWMKDKAGLGQYFRGITEHCLFCTTKKRLPYKISKDLKRCQGITGFVEPKREHSRKPDKMVEMIQIVSYRPAIELFAREQRRGWDCWGNEVQS